MLVHCDTPVFKDVPLLLVTIIGIFASVYKVPIGMIVAQPISMKTTHAAKTK